MRIIEKNISLKETHKTKEDFSSLLKNTEREFSTLLDKTCAHKIKEVLDTKKTRNVRRVFLVGAGGSVSGARAAYGALSRAAIPRARMSFIENIGDVDMHENEIAELSSPDEYLLFIVSASGNTLETLVNADRISAFLRKKFSSCAERTIIVTKETSPLKEFAERGGVSVLLIPERFSGRFSFFSSAGMAPLYAAGADIENMLSAAEATEQEILKNPSSNSAIRTAFTAWSYQKTGKSIFAHLFLDASLAPLGGWCRQVVAESIGKRGADGETIGFLPDIIAATADMHSVFQMHMCGKYPAFFEIVSLANTCGGEYVVSGEYARISPEMYGKKESDICNALKDAIEKSYTENFPATEFLLDALSEQEIASFMMHKMHETIHLASFFGVNPFDQPCVDVYKESARRTLSS